MARGKHQSKPEVAVKKPRKYTPQPYVCTLCHHHHGRWTKIANEHRQYAR